MIRTLLCFKSTFKIKGRSALYYNANKRRSALGGKPTKYVEEAISISNADLILPPNDEKLAADAKTDSNSCLF